MTPSGESLPEQQTLGEDAMIGRDRWDEIHRLAASHVTIAEIARRLDADRKAVARCLRQDQWQPYRRAGPAETLLTPHVAFLQERAPAVNYSARILWQELRAHHRYAGSYETVKRFIRPLREEGLRASLTWTRFETPPGVQTQIDWGQARVHAELHVAGVRCERKPVARLMRAARLEYAHRRRRTRTTIQDPTAALAPTWSPARLWPTVRIASGVQTSRTCGPGRAGCTSQSYWMRSVADPWDLEGVYNSHRRHSALGYLAPAEFDRRWKSQIRSQAS